MRSDGLGLSSSLLISPSDLISQPESGPHLLAPCPVLLTCGCQFRRLEEEAPEAALGGGKWGLQLGEEPHVEKEPPSSSFSSTLGLCVPAYPTVVASAFSEG